MEDMKSVFNKERRIIKINRTNSKVESKLKGTLRSLVHFMFSFSLVKLS